MRLRTLRSTAAALCALILLTGCIEPPELTLLRRTQEPRVLAGTASAERFWRRADAVAQAYRAPAKERAQIARMVEIGRRADRGQISLQAYRAHHAAALARYEAQRQAARRDAARLWSRVLGGEETPAPVRLVKVD